MKNICVLLLTFVLSGFILCQLGFSSPGKPGVFDETSGIYLQDENSLFKRIDFRPYRDLIQLFDERARQYYHDPAHRFDKGFFLNRLDPIPLLPIEKEDGYLFPHAAESMVKDFRGYTVAVAEDREKIYLSEKKDFSDYVTILRGNEIPALKHYYFDSVSSQGLQLLFGHLKPNTRACRAFLEMFRITRNSKYLKPARRILVYLIDRVDEDGLYRLPFPDVPLKYRAMYHSYLLQILYDYVQLSPQKDAYLENALQTISQSYRFTDEGTRDHWLEATIGSVIIDRLGIQTFDMDELTEELDVLFGYIKRFAGKIPFCLRLCDPPQFVPNYQNYNTMLLAILSAKYLKRDIGILEILPEVFKVAKKEGDWRLFRGLYYAKLQFGFDDVDWAEEWRKQVLLSESFFDIPVLIKYKIFSETFDSISK